MTAIHARVAVVAGAAMACYVALPLAAANAFFQVVAWGSIAALIAGIRRHRAVTVPWVLIIAGWVSFAVGDLIFTLYDDVLHIEPFPSVADVFYIAGYPFITLGLAALVRRTRPDGDRIALIDASIVLVPLAIAAWIYVIEPYASGGGSTLLEQTVSGAYPFGDVLCLAVAIRLFTGSRTGRQHGQPAMSLVGAGLLFMLVADIWFVRVELTGGYASGDLIDALYLVPYITIGAAALTPSVRDIGAPRPKTDPSLGSLRLTLLAIAALVTPSLLIVEWFTQHDLTVPLIVAGTAISFLLVIARMASIVEALETSRATLAHDASHDHLTGLANRGLFADHLESAIGRWPTGSLLFIDLDNFKRVNDRYGHLEGDQLLVRVGERLQECVRDADTVARLSGDEFGVLLPGADEHIAELLACRLLESLTLRCGDDEDMPVTASIGAVTWSPAHRAQSAQALLNVADRAMYRAKAEAGNCHVADVPSPVH